MWQALYESVVYSGKYNDTDWFVGPVEKTGSKQVNR